MRKVNGQYKPFDNFRKSWDSARKRAGLDDFVFHDFRHVAISNLRKAGNSPTVIMKASGHKTMSMFIRYDLLDQQDLKRIKWVDSESESNNEDFGEKTPILRVPTPSRENFEFLFRPFYSFSKKYRTH